MSRYSSLVPGIALVWAGVSIGGSLIATPAKFQAPSLTMPTALEVGRATFQWLGIAEATLCAALLLALIAPRGVRWWWTLVPVLLFAVQRLAILPVLDERTLRIIAGEGVEPSNLHIVYIAIEALKCLALLTAGVAGLTASAALPVPDARRIEMREVG